jgi:hypothetical protein
MTPRHYRLVALLLSIESLHHSICENCFALLLAWVFDLTMQPGNDEALLRGAHSERACR